MNDDFFAFDRFREVVDFKRDMRNLLDDPGQGAIVAVSHPLNAERIGFVIGAVNIQRFQVDLPFPGNSGRNAHVIVFHRFDFTISYSGHQNKKSKKQ